MARLLTPADYGVVGMIAIFIAISNSLINSGFSQALIRKTDRTEIDNSTVFYFNIVVGLFLYAVLFFCAPFIARFYDMPILTPVTRVVGIGLIFNSLCIVQIAQYTINIDFKTQAKATFTAAVFSGIAGITMAYLGFGVWAIVWQQVVSFVINSALLWFYSKWRPIWSYSWRSFKEMFGFGSKLLVTGLIDTGYNNIYSLVIGKVFKAADLGFYSRSQTFSSFASANVTDIIKRVTFPVLCKIQTDDDKLQDGYRRLLRVAAFIIFPLMMGMAGVAVPMIVTLVGEKWLYSAILLVPICFSGMWYPVHSINLNLLSVKGRSDLILRLEIIKKILGIAVLAGTVPLGLYWMCWGGLLSSIIALVINTYYTGKLIDLGFWKQMKDLFPTLILSVTMGAMVWLTMQFLTLPNPILLVIGIIEGGIIYIVGAKLFRFPEFAEIRSLLKRNKQ